MRLLPHSECKLKENMSTSAAPVANRNPLFDSTHIAVVKPLLGNKGLHSLNGNINNSKPPTYTCPCKTCGKPVKSNQHEIFCDGCELCSHRRCIHMSVAEYNRFSQPDQANCTCFCCVFSLPQFFDSFFDEPST